MNDSNFMRTVTFGGFDKADVLEQLEAMNTQNNSLKNELRDTKYLLNALKSGSNVEKAAETALEVNREILTKFQTTNKSLSDKLNIAIEENAASQQKIADMQKEIDDLNYQLKKANDMISALQADSKAAAFGTVFNEVQKASDMLIEDAKAQSAQIISDAEKAAKETVAGANTLAAKIINEAEMNASQTVSDAEKRADEITQTSYIARSALSRNADILTKNIEALKAALAESDRLVLNMASALSSEEVMAAAVEAAEKRMAEDEAAAQELDSNSEETAADAEPVPETEQETPKEAEKPAAPKKKGKIDLAALAAQANALNKKN